MKTIATNALILAWVATWPVFSQSEYRVTVPLPNPGDTLVIEFEGNTDPPVITPGMVHVPAAAFTMGDTFGGNQPDPDEYPAHAVTLDAFEVARFNVTNAEWADMLNWALANGRIHVAKHPSGEYRDVTLGDAQGVLLTNLGAKRNQVEFDGAVFAPGDWGYVNNSGGLALKSMADYPAVEMTWYGAAMYANWLSEQSGFALAYDTATWQCDFTKNGYRLLTEAEWEYAASGGTYKYGTSLNTISCNDANTARPGGQGGGWCNPERWTDEPFLTLPGFYPYASHVGAYDMAGNVWDWCNDWYAADYYAVSPTNNPRGPATGTDKVRRGGSNLNAQKWARAANRDMLIPGEPYSNIGIRLTRSVTE